ncbi:MarR family winged helix-turn-helix transcriptional regulator [Aureimonas frigidaquae]|uniref:MarR family winged helix-turn-helix transcriptional regulator n=1 Tax=Aureimonas frigidaquae TaxID=424757 RepID=UPI000780A0FB|nr:MarR family transcriptional regulator [Aureimonas frigidaquae]
MTRLSAPPPLDDQLCFALYQASMEVGRLYKPLLDRLGITYPQYLVLNALWERDAQTVGAIADRLSLEASTLTPLLKRLDAAGLVERRRNPADERQVVVSLTAQGLALRSGSACLGQSLMRACGMSAAALTQLQNEVRALADTLRALDAPSHTVRTGAESSA